MCGEGEGETVSAGSALFTNDLLYCGELENSDNMCDIDDYVDNTCQYVDCVENVHEHVMHAEKGEYDVHVKHGCMYDDGIENTRENIYVENVREDIAHVDSMYGNVHAETKCEYEVYNEHMCKYDDSVEHFCGNDVYVENVCKDNDDVDNMCENDSDIENVYEDNDHVECMCENVPAEDIGEHEEYVENMCKNDEGAENMHEKNVSSQCVSRSSFSNNMNADYSSLLCNDKSTFCNEEYVSNANVCSRSQPSFCAHTSEIYPDRTYYVSKSKPIDRWVLNLSPYVASASVQEASDVLVPDCTVSVSEACSELTTVSREVQSSETRSGPHCVTFSCFDESLFGAPVPESDSSDSASYHSAHSFSDDVRPNNIRNNKDSLFTFMHWNVNGLQFKIFDSDFLHFVSSFDFVCLVETFVQSIREDVFPDYTVFCQPATKLTARGRPSGGVVCLIKNHLMPFIRQLEVKVGNFLLFDVNKQVFGTDKNVLFVCAYLPPEGSNYYPFMNESDGVSMLENCLVDCVLGNNDYHILIAGDLNSRTANISQNISLDNNYFLQSSHPASIGRQSQDSVLNQYGKLLLNMCVALNLCILNGVCYGDHEGRYTYVSDFGSSVIDYFLLSSDLYALVSDSCKLTINERIDSSHLPVVLSISFPNENVSKASDNRFSVCSERYLWNSNHSEEFKNKLIQENTRRQLERAIDLIDVDVDCALDVFNDCLKEVAECMKKRIVVGKKSKQDWFDHECVMSRRKVRKALRKYCRSPNEEYRHSYCTLRREYKNLLHRKKKIFNESICNKLLESINDQKTFWDVVNNTLPKRKFNKNDISIEQWYDHFKHLLEQEQDNNNIDLGEFEGEHNEHLNRPISVEEVSLAIKKLKLKKSSGPDGIVGEFLRFSPDFTVPFFVKFLNALFDRGIYPDRWNESIILPLYKKGNRSEPGNYRGISLCNVGSKVYSSIINNRLQQWATENNVTGEHQAGFKKNYSTIDHMFTLLACVQKQFNSNSNRKLYVAFIDFEKAFDSINRHILWRVLLKYGLSGKIFNCIRSMYSNVKAKVKSGVKLTEFIRCTAGVKQGDILSPVLFTLFVNELANDIIQNGRHGVTFSIDTLELFILLLADDIVLLAETIVGLQTQLNILHQKSLSLGLRVNLSKSNIIVFRKGGYLGSRERWFLGNSNMQVVNAYKYLGIYFTTKLSFTAACNDLVSKAKNATFCLLRKLRELNVFSVKLFFKLFDAQIQPIALYGSEIWGLDTAAKNCEKVHLFAMKKLLGVEMRTPNDLVYAELNRFPILINAVIRCIRYWLKITRMEPHRLPKKAYVMLRRMDERGLKTWASNVRLCLFQNGFGFVWLNDGVQNVNAFLRLFRQRLVDCQWQTLNFHMHNSDRFYPYRLFASNIESKKTYFTLNMDNHLKFLMTRFRFGISNLAVHRYRFRYHSEEEIKCPLCRSSEDNEIHFLLCCPGLSKLRKELIPAKYHRNPNLFKMALLMSCKAQQTVQNLCIYLYRAFKIREIVTS